MYSKNPPPPWTLLPGVQVVYPESAPDEVTLKLMEMFPQAHFKPNPFVLEFFFFPAHHFDIENADEISFSELTKEVNKNKFSELKYNSKRKKK